MIVFRPATLADAHFVGSNLRPEDEREATASGLKDTGYEAVMDAFMESHGLCFSIYTDSKGTPCALFGAREGAVWMLCTPEVVRHTRSILKEAPVWLDHLSSFSNNMLYSLVDLRNVLHIEWCKKLGFIEGVTCNIADLPFALITRTTNV